MSTTPSRFSPGRLLTLAVVLALLLAVTQLVLQVCTLRTREQLLESEQQFAALQLRSASQHAEAERLVRQRELADAQNQVQALRARAAEADAQVTKLATELASVEAQLARERASLVEAKAELTAKSAELATLRAAARDR